MEYTHLGSSGLRVSRLCLGTMNFGPVTTEPDSHAIMDAALELGINLVDTANVYGWRRGEGYTEQIIGRWFATGGGRREKVVIATKLYGSMGDWPNDTYLSALNIVRACEGSLRRLRTDHIDLYQMHHVDRNTPWEEIWQAMDTLIRQGKIIYAGSSNFAGWQIAQAEEAARRRHLVGLSCEQSKYNLLQRTVELEVLPACRSYGLGVLPYSPLERGLLGGILRKEHEGRAYPPATVQRLDERRSQIEAYETLCHQYGHDPADVAVAWLLQQPGVTAPIVGPRTEQQLRSSTRALDITLGETELAELDRLFPGPGGPAPEAYAW